jgi:hypothetical protein
MAWVAAVLAASPVAAAPVDGWQVFGPDALGVSREQVAAQVPLQCSSEAGEPDSLACQPASGALSGFAGVPVQKIELTFRGDRLEKVAGRLHESHFEALERFITAHAGEGSDCSYRFRGGMGAAEFVNRILLWRTPGYALVIQQFQGKIDRSVFNYGTQAAMADVVKEKTAYPPGSRRDL